MTREIHPFAEEHLDGAAKLLAGRHQRQMLREPRLPSRYGSSVETRPLIEALLPRSDGVVALEDGRLAGYLLGHPDLDWGGRANLVPMEGHAVDHPDAVEVYREM